MKKRTLAMLLAAGMAFTMAGCGSSGENSASSSDSNGSATVSSGSASESGEKTYDLQVISKGLNNSWMQTAQKACMDTADDINEEAGYEKVKVSYVGPESQSDIAVQVQQFADAISSGADCIGLGALDVDSVSDLCDDAAKAGIPIVTWCSDIEGKEAVKSFVATNSYAAAGEAADKMYDKIKDRIGDEQVRVGVVSSSAVAQDHIERGLGFIDEFIARCNDDGKKVAVDGNDKFTADAKGEIVSESDADVIIEIRVPSTMTVELTSTEAGALLNEDDLIGIFGNTQDAVEGILVANENLNVLGCEDDDVICVGFDAGEVQEEAVRSGVEFGAVNQAPYDIGKQLVETMLKAAEGEEVSDVETAYVYFDAENIDSEEVVANLY